MLWIMLALMIGYLMGRGQPYVRREWRRRRYRHAYARALLEPRAAAFRHTDDIQQIAYRVGR